MKTFRGGCHCGAVSFEVSVDVETEPEVVVCNCSICRKKGFEHLIVPEAAFVLTAGEEHLTTYRFNTGEAEHRFCRRCGIHSFYRPRSHPEGISVNASCVEDVDGFIASIPRRPFDGDNWEANIDELRSSDS